MNALGKFATQQDQDNELARLVSTTAMLLRHDEEMIEGGDLPWPTEKLRIARLAVLRSIRHSMQEVLDDDDNHRLTWPLNSYQRMLVGGLLDRVSKLLVVYEKERTFQEEFDQRLNAIVRRGRDLTSMMDRQLKYLGRPTVTRLVEGIAAALESAMQVAEKENFTVSAVQRLSVQQMIDELQAALV